MAPDTLFMRMSYPDENQDPYFESMRNFFSEVDQNLYALVAANQPVIGGGILRFEITGTNPFSGTLSWTEDFEVLVPSTGLYMRFPYGPDGTTRQISLMDGDYVVVNVPISSAGGVGSVTKINGRISPEIMDIRGLTILGVARGGSFYSNVPWTIQQSPNVDGGTY